ncbi:MAG: VTT domain-containing protein [Isosphaeraceae bacterium]|nr:VTT domain-containing protein [Isosphaeraceae bacterium]
MQELLQPLLDLLNPEFVVKAGYVLMTIIIFVETGLLIGFCLPGDSLLVTAGIFAARGDLNIWWINLLLIPAAILGDTLGYWIGYHSGPRLFKRPKSLLFNPDHLIAAQEFYERHGGKTIVLARFMPIVRTFAPLVAGMGRMNYRTFLFYNIFGGIGWITSMSLLGFYVGRLFPNSAKKLEFVVIAVVIVSILPGLIPVAKKQLGKRRAAREARESMAVATTAAEPPDAAV